jgi:DNA-binding response OmpR family regulator
VNQKATLQKEEQLTATTNLAATSTIPVFELRRLFSSEGYEVDVVPANLADLDMFRQRPPSAVILDLPYAESLGWDLCRKIAKLIPGLPLVILSASSDVADKVLLLEMGADDYVSIPFSPRELVDRLRAVMRRASNSVRNASAAEFCGR